MGAVKPGAAFTVVAAMKQPDGSFDINRINVGRDGRRAAVRLLVVCLMDFGHAAFGPRLRGPLARQLLHFEALPSPTPGGRP